MTIRLDMLKAASQARRQLGDSADLVVEFITKQLNPDGGFKGRGGQSDLYYTVFGIESLLGLGDLIPKERITNYLLEFGDGCSLDLVHLSCLARCWADISNAQNMQLTSAIARNIEEHRCSDGGYNVSMGAAHGSAYGCFLALSAHQDLNIRLQNAGAMVDCIRLLRLPDGSYSNDTSVPIGSVPATAAALAVLHYLNEPVDNLSVDWLLSQNHPKGGFAVIPLLRDDAAPDLLSTATALHTLALVGISTGSIKQKCLDFVNSLWNPEGGFRGNRTDDTLDCEYTYYGLLALGHLSE